MSAPGAAPRVLVTGASGFLGRPCVARLVALGYEVHAVSTQPGKAAASAAGSVVWHEANLLVAGAAKGVLARVAPSHLLHLAWCVAPGKFWWDPDNVRWLTASVELVTAFLESGGRRLVTAGTAAEYDWRHAFLSESTTPLAPASLYGAAKLAVGTMGTLLAARGGATGASGRIFYLHGPGEHPDRLVPVVCRALLAGERVRFGSGAQVRDYLFVEDAADALVALLGSTASGAVNIASGVPVRLRDLVSGIAACVDRPELIDLGVLPDRPDDPPVLLADVRRLREEVGWKPARTLEAGLEATARWWQRAGNVAAD